MMLKPYTLLLALLLAVFTTGCEQIDDDYYTQAEVTLQLPDSITPLKVQGTVTLKNLSNSRVYASSDFDKTTIRLDVMRGTYMLDAEGTMLCRYPDGSERVKYYRSSKDYVEIIDHPTRFTATVIFM